MNYLEKMAFEGLEKKLLEFIEKTAERERVNKSDVVVFFRNGSFAYYTPTKGNQNLDLTTL